MMMSTNNDEEQASGPHQQQPKGGAEQALTPTPRNEDKAKPGPDLLVELTNFVLQAEQTDKNEEIIEQHVATNDEVLPDITRKVPFLPRVAARFPRIYYSFTQLIFPLLVLIGMAILFGWILARIEAPDEIKRNDGELGDVFSKCVAFELEGSRIRDAIQTAPGMCLMEYDNNVTVNELIATPGKQDILDALLDCKYSFDKFSTVDIPDCFTRADPQLSFDWITCDRYNKSFTDDTLTDKVFGEILYNETNETSTKDDEILQKIQYTSDFMDPLISIVVKDLNESGFVPENELAFMIFLESVFALHIKNVTGSKSCKPHVGGGALFWFTVMTTVGYGNVAPKTISGRLLIYSCGFITIIGFLALNASASYILATIVDDFLIRIRLRRLTKGFAAVLFWLCLLIFWMLVVAFAARAFVEGRSGESFPLRDAYWFSYITATTVGLGDEYLHHAEIKVMDMFYIPLLMLSSFVILGNFASKLSSCMVIWFPVDMTLESILEATREPEESTVSS